MEEHTHSHDIDFDTATRKEKKAYFWAILIAIVFMLAEIIGGFAANSLALLSDALHMFVDVGSLILALIVVFLMRRPSNKKKSYGYHRAEVLGALASGCFLWAMLAFIIYEAIERLFNPPQVHGTTVFVIATLGLFANIAMLKLLHPGKKGSLNLKAAYLHVLSDLLGSVGVILSGIIIMLTQFNPIDPIFSILFACLIFYTSGKMMKESLDILMEGAPKHLDLSKIQKDLENLPGVKKVHDLHIWNISSKIIALSAHLIGDEPQKTLLHEAHDMLQKKYHIYHSTLQVETSGEFDCHQCFDCQKKLYR